MIFSCTNPILFLLISGMFSAHSSFVLNMCFNSDRRHTPDGNLFIFNLSHAPLLCDTFLPSHRQVGASALSGGGWVVGGVGIVR